MIVGCSSSHPPTTGTVTGTLLEQAGLSGGENPHAGTVTATPVKGGAPVTVKTGARSVFVLRLPAGMYKITGHIGGEDCVSANVGLLDVHAGKVVNDDVGC